MEKGFRIVVCPEPCKTRLRLKITKEQYGKTLEVTCPKCSLKFRVTIPVPAMRNGGSASDELVGEDPFGVFKKLDKLFRRNK